MITILTMITTFIATGIDEMIILILIFAHARNHNQIRQVYIGQQIGMTFIIVVALLALYGITSLFTGKWTGLIGLLPIIMGIMELVERDDDDESGEVLQKSAIFSNLTLRVTLIAIAGGAEELAIYIPYFTSLESQGLLLALITFVIMVPIWCAICQKLGSMKNVYELVKRYERILIPVVFIGIGLNVLVESDTLEAILDLFL
ncbi:cadmium resistance transporter [Ornithinibacillus scapharcae]|uniref:cadmium resistance transporter n=1 Tax=Ornithinibacillus scapharcae TaxID=1147159 RepID=UPI000225BD0A|nr:cadmium resistance transporter [Ornithinibacillus scapharcae]